MMRRTRAAADASASTPTPAGRAPAAPTRPSRLKQSVTVADTESASTSSGSRSRQTSSEDDLVKRMAKTRIDTGTRPAVAAPLAPRRATAATRLKASASAPSTTSGSKAPVPSAAASRTLKPGSRPPLSTANPATPAVSQAPSITPALTPAQQSLRIKTNINLSFRSLTAALTSGFRRDISTVVTLARTKASGSKANPAADTAWTPSGKSTPSGGKENADWTEEAVVKVINEGAEGFRELSALPESKERSKIREMEKTRAGFAGKCIALGFPDLALESLVEGRNIILSLYPTAGAATQSATTGKATAPDVVAPLPAKTVTKKTPTRATRTPRLVKTLIVTPPSLKQKWLALLSLPDVEAKKMEQIEEGSRVALCNHVLTSWIGVFGIVETEADAKKLLASLKSPNLDSAHGMHPLSLGRSVPSDPNISVLLNHTIHAMSRLDRRIPHLTRQRSYQRVKLELWITSASLSSKVTAGQVWASMEASASRFFNVDEHTEDEETAGMREAAILLEEALDWVERATVDSPVKLARQGKEWLSLMTFWMGLGRNLEESAITNRVASLEQENASVESADLAGALESLSIDAQDAIQLLTQARGTLAKLTDLIDRSSALNDTQKSLLLSSLKDHQTLRQFFTALSHLNGEGITSSIRSAINVLDRARRRVSSVASSDGPLGSSVSAASRAWLTALTQHVDSYLVVVAQCNSSDSVSADLAAMAIDTLCQRSKDELVVSDPAAIGQTQLTLEAAVTIQSRCHGMHIDSADWTRCIGASYYNIGAVLWKASMLASALDFFKPSAEISDAAIKLGRCDKANSVITDAQWTALVEQVPRRWEIVASCQTKLQDKKGAANAYLCAVLARDPITAAEMLSKASHRAMGLGAVDDPALATCIGRLTSFCQQEALCFEQDFDDIWQGAIGRESAAGFAALVFEELARNLGRSAHRDGVASVIDKICSALLGLYVGAERTMRRLASLVVLLQLSTVVELSNRDMHALDTEAMDLCRHLGKNATDVDAQSVRVCEAQILICRITAQYNHQSSRVPDAYMTDLIRTRDTLRQMYRSDASIVDAEDQEARPNRLKELAEIVHVLDGFVPIVRIIGDSIISLDYLRLLRQAQSVNGIYHANYISTSCQLALEYAALGKMARASKVFISTKAIATRQDFSEAQCAHLHLSHALFLAMTGNVNDSRTSYASAQNTALDVQDIKHVSSISKIKQKVELLDRAALAHLTAAEIALTRDDADAAIAHRGSAYKLLNKALDSLSRLTPISQRSKTAGAPSNPFLGASLTNLGAEAPSADEVAQGSAPKWQDIRVNQLPAEHLRISGALLSTMCLLGRDYLHRGSSKDAESMLSQAANLATAMQSDLWQARTACLLGEAYSVQHKFEAAREQVERALHVLSTNTTVETVDVARVKGLLELKQKLPEDAQQTFAGIFQLLAECEKSLGASEILSGSPTRLSNSQPSRTDPAITNEADGLPGSGAGALSRHARLLFEVGQEQESRDVMTRLRGCAISTADKALVQHATGTMAASQAFSLFKNDLFMNSLTESALSMPTGSTNSAIGNDATRQDAMKLLTSSEKAFGKYLSMAGGQGEIAEVREAAVTSALLMCYQTSLGRGDARFMTAAVNLLDATSALTLSRETIDSAENKSRQQRKDDALWPELAPGSRSDSPRSSSGSSASLTTEVSTATGEYWTEVAARHRNLLSANIYDTGEIDRLPRDWSVVTINVTDDHKTLIVVKHKAGQKPILFCLPIDRQGKREEEEEDSFTYDAALDELKGIIGDSDKSAKAAKDTTTKEGKAAWWATRIALDTRLAELLTNIEFCWLGAFKTIFQSTPSMAQEDLEMFRHSLQRSFGRALSAGGKNGVKLELDADIVRCFAALSPVSKPEELDDLVYYLLDLYQFHGVPVAQAEIDTDQLGIEVQAALQTLHSKTEDADAGPPSENDHLFLVLDRKVQSFPWESLPVLRGRSISRIPSMAFLFDRLPTSGNLADWRREVPINNTQFVVNPSADLKNTQAFFEPWLEEMKAKYGWRGVAGEPPSELQLKGMLKDSDLVLYMGHGGAEAYIRSQQIRSLRTCATTMLWGCSSGLLVDGGDLDPTGTPYNYMIAGCPSLVANLWDITDKDIDKMTLTVYQRTGMMADQTKFKLGQVSNAQAVNGARDGCKLKYLTGAAPVVFGLPVYLIEKAA